MLTGAIGCEMKENALYKYMVSHMKETYDDTFEFVTSYGGSAGSSIHSIYVRSERYPQTLVSVNCIITKGKDLFYDNYLAVKYEEQTRNLLNQIMKNYGTEILLFYVPANQAYYENGSDSISFGEFLQEKSSSITYTVLVKNNYSLDQERIEEKLRQDMEQNRICCNGTIYFCKDNPDFTTLNKDNYYYQYLAKETYESACTFYMSEPGIITEYEWRKIR